MILPPQAMEDLLWCKNHITNTCSPISRFQFQKLPLRTHLLLGGGLYVIICESAVQVETLVNYFDLVIAFSFFICTYMYIFCCLSIVPCESVSQGHIIFTFTYFHFLP
jgi:hypothetical protein